MTGEWIRKPSCNLVWGGAEHRLLQLNPNAPFYPDLVAMARVNRREGGRSAVCLAELHRVGLLPSLVKTAYTVEERVAKARVRECVLPLEDMIREHCEKEGASKDTLLGLLGMAT